MCVHDVSQHLWSSVFHEAAQLLEKAWVWTIHSLCPAPVESFAHVPNVPDAFSPLLAVSVCYLLRFVLFKNRIRNNLLITLYNFVLFNLHSQHLPLSLSAIHVLLSELCIRDVCFICIDCIITKDCIRKDLYFLSLPFISSAIIDFEINEGSSRHSFSWTFLGIGTSWSTYLLTILQVADEKSWYLELAAAESFSDGSVVGNAT